MMSDLKGLRHVIWSSAINYKNIYISIESLQAYKNFGARISNMKKRVDDMKKIIPSTPSPVPSPSADAPSPGGTPPLQDMDDNDMVDMDLSDDEAAANSLKQTGKNAWKKNTIFFLYLSLYLLSSNFIGSLLMDGGWSIMLLVVCPSDYSNHKIIPLYLTLSYLHQNL